VKKINFFEEKLHTFFGAWLRDLYYGFYAVWIYGYSVLRDDVAQQVSFQNHEYVRLRVERDPTFRTSFENMLQVTKVVSPFL